MNEFSYQFFFGFLCTLFLFGICLISVVIFKVVYIYFKNLINPPKTELVAENPPRKKRKYKRQRQANPSVVRSLEIDTKDVDRIYFKKSS